MGVVVGTIAVLVCREKILEVWLIRQLNRGDEAAATRLAEMGSVEAIPLLLELRVATAEEALLQINHTAGKAALPYLAQGMKYDDLYTRYLSATLIGNNGADIDTVQAKLAQSGWAMPGPSTHLFDTTKERIRALLTHEDENVCQAAREALRLMEK